MDRVSIGLGYEVREIARDLVFTAGRRAWEESYVEHQHDDRVDG